MTSLRDPQVKAFLSEGAKVGKLGYLAGDGRPIVVPVWFLAQDDETIVFHTRLDSAKGRALRRDPRATLTVDVETLPYSYVQVQGVAELDAVAEREIPVFREIARRYLSPEAADEFVAKTSQGGALFVLRPTKVVTLFNPG